MCRAEWRFWTISPGGMEIPTRSEKPSNPRILDNPKKSQSNNNNKRNTKFLPKNNPKTQKRVGIKNFKNWIGCASERFQRSDHSWHLQLQQQHGVQLFFPFLPAIVKIAISTAPYGFCWKLHFHYRLSGKPSWLAIKKTFFLCAVRNGDSERSRHRQPKRKVQHQRERSRKKNRTNNFVSCERNRNRKLFCHKPNV